MGGHRIGRSFSFPSFFLAHVFLALAGRSVPDPGRFPGNDIYSAFQAHAAPPVPLIEYGGFRVHFMITFVAL